MDASDEGTCRPDKTESSQGASFPPWVVGVVSAFVTAIGFSGFLYAFGFLATRSHQTFWGLWGGPAEDAADLISEGGRFLYHLAFVFIDLLGPLSSGTLAVFFVAFIVGQSLWEVPTVAMRGFFARRTLFARILRVVLPLALMLATYAWGLALLKSIASMIEPHNLLTQEGLKPEQFDELVCTPSKTYSALISGWIFLGTLFAANIWALRLNDNKAVRVVAWLGGLFVLATASLLPAAYGRLILLPDYPQIEFSRDEGNPVERVLIRAAGSQWVVWNLAVRKTEVISLRGDETVVIGKRQQLVSWSCCPRGDSHGQK